MKKNDQSFDSFIIVESENNTKEKNSPKKNNLKTSKKIRNQILEKEDENFEEDEFIELKDNYHPKNKKIQNINEMLEEFEEDNDEKK